jgi:hypothetical protein
MADLISLGYFLCWLPVRVNMLWKWDRMSLPTA